MDLFLFQSILPFILSAMIVIIITVVAEKYGTKVGGILGTLPSLSRSRPRRRTKHSPESGEPR